MIFNENQTWTSMALEMDLHPVLIGHDLQELYDGFNKPIYISLVSGDISGALRYKDAFFNSLRKPWSYNQETMEVVFTESNITLNVHEVVKIFETIAIIGPKRLFSYEDKQLQSAVLYFKGRHLFHNVGPEDIAGIGNTKTLEAVSDICGIALKYPNGSPIYRKTQALFTHPNCPNVAPFKNGQEIITS